MAIRIDTLGTLRIAVNAREEKALQAQKLRCSLLVYIAVEGTTTRDRVLLDFWPDRPDDRARHALSQTLYELRRTLGDGWLETHGDRLAVIGAVTVDAVEFERALDAGARAEALRLYRGPFLQGHHLHETRGFEGWVEQQRAHLARRHRQARREQLKELLAAGAADEIYGAARDWAEVDPLEDEAQHLLIEAMLARGERTAAIRQYERYRDLVRRELEVEPLEETTTLIERVRAERAVAGLERTRAEGQWEAGRGREEESPLPAPTPTALPPPARRRQKAGRRTRGTGMAAAVVMAIAAIIAATVVAYNLLIRTDAPAPSDRPRAAILPFDASAGAPLSSAEVQGQLARWLELGLKLDAIVRPGGAADGNTAPGGSAARLAAAREVGAAVAIAPFVADGRLAADVMDPRTGRTLFRSSAPPAEELRSAIPHLALHLMRTLTGAGIARAEDPPALETTTSPEALRYLLEARLAFSQSDADRAEAALRGAIAADPTAALPYHRLSMVYVWAPRWDYVAGLAVVDSGLSQLAPSDSRGRRLLTAQRYYGSRHSEHAIQAFERLTVDHPDLTDAWVGLGEALFHLGGSIGLDRSTAQRPFREAIQRDSLAAPLYFHLAELAVLKGEKDEFERSRAALEGAPDLKAIATAMSDFQFGDEAAVAATIERLRTADRRTVLFVLAYAARGNRNPGLADTLSALLLEPVRTPEERLWGARYDLVTSAGRDDWSDALRRWDQLARAAAFDGWIVQAEFAGHPTGGRAADMLDRLRITLGRDGPPNLSERPNQRALEMAQALVTDALLHGDSAHVARLRTLLGLPTDTAPRMADPLPHYWRSTLEAREALLADDTAAAIAALRAGVTRVAYPYVFAPLLSGARERLLLADLLAASGRPELADPWYRSFEESEFLVDVMFLNRPQRGTGIPYDNEEDA